VYLKKPFFNFFSHLLGVILIGMTLLCGFVVLSKKNLAEKDAKEFVIVIDAGHGGRDPGTLGTGVHEKDVTLQVSLELGRIIKSNIPDTKIIYTRLADKFVALYRRAEIANENRADLFISIHCNSVGGSTATRNSVKGTEIYVMGLHKNEENLEVAKRENAAILKEANYEAYYEGFDPNSPQSYILLSLRQQTHLTNSLNLAHKIDYQLRNRANRTSRGVKQAGFVVLAKTTMPSVLIELGFLSNPEEEKYLQNAQNQVYLASAIYRAVKAYKEEVN
jgi:N-acetylmuramoyl-L-alanine amidase